jgi:hypothetical protein
MIVVVHGMPGRILSGDDKIRGLEIAVSDFAVQACFAFPNGRIIQMDVIEKGYLV